MALEQKGHFKGMKLYGKNPVLERLKSAPQSIRKIHIQSGHPDQGYIQKKARKWGIPVLVAPASKLVKMARNLNTQGLVADVEGFAYVPFDELLQQTTAEGDSLVFLDGLNDPQNLGGIIRSLACFGGFALVIPTHKSVEVTETVLRVACGGENHVPVAKVPNLAQALVAAKEAGCWVVGTVPEGGRDITDERLNFPLALVIGSEHKGMRDVVRRQVDAAVTLPMAHARMSLNAAHAATVFCYEIFRQRRVTQVKTSKSQNVQ